MKKLYLSCLFALLCVGVTSAQELKDSFEVYFEFNKAVLKEESKTTIDSFLEVTQGRRLKVRVTGHTCDIGTENYNMGLSEKRAQSAFEYLKSKEEPEDIIELFFYGEKELKYGEGGKPQNRRVHVLFALEDDDRDTLLKAGCLEILVEKGTFKPKKNKNIEFQYKELNNGRDVQAAGIKMEDENGKRYYANAIAYFDASIDGEQLEPGKSLKVKLPAVGEDEEGFMLFTGVEQDGKILWKSTGKPCGAATEEGADCPSYQFDFQFKGYCGCLKERACEEDCSQDPFGGERSPDLKAEDIRYSGAKTVARFPEGMYPQALADMDVNIVDDTNFDEDCDLCEQFEYGITTDQWFPAFSNIDDKKNIIIKAKDGSGNEVKGNQNATLRVMVPRDQVKDLENPVLLPGSRHSKGYIKWDMAKFEQTKCLGPVNCEYVVFDVPGTGNYKLGEWSESTEGPGEEKYVLKTRVLKNCEVFVGDKSNNFVYKTSLHERGGKERAKEHDLREAKDMGQLVLLVKHTNSKGTKFRYAEVALSDLKYKAGKQMYVLRKRQTKKIKDWKEMELTKCK
jgi:hypothetical protein